MFPDFERERRAIRDITGLHEQLQTLALPRAAFRPICPRHARLEHHSLGASGLFLVSWHGLVAPYAAAGSAGSGGSTAHSRPERRLRLTLSSIEATTKYSPGSC